MASCIFVFYFFRFVSFRSFVRNSFNLIFVSARFSPTFLPSWLLLLTLFVIGHAAVIALPLMLVVVVLFGFVYFYFPLNFVPQRWTGRKHWNNCWYANESSISTIMLRIIRIWIGIDIKGASLDNRSGKLNWIELNWISNPSIRSCRIGFCVCLRVRVDERVWEWEREHPSLSLSLFIILTEWVCKFVCVRVYYVLMEKFEWER